MLAHIFSACSSLQTGDDRALEAPNRGFSFVSQKGFFQTACGPVSLINAVGSGAPQWRALLADYKQPFHGVNDLIYNYGSEPSVVFKNRNRWNGRMGMNLPDLTQTALDFSSKSLTPLPTLSSEIITINKGDLSDLRKVHHYLAHSLKNGFPPIMNITRNAFRHTKASPEKIWDFVGSHSVVITQLNPISSQKKSFSVLYVDPTNGKELSGEIQISSLLGHPKSVLEFKEASQSNIFKKGLTAQTQNYLSVNSVIGAL